jgi:hypothetical protein
MTGETQKRKAKQMMREARDAHEKKQALRTIRTCDEEAAPPPLRWSRGKRIDRGAQGGNTDGEISEIWNFLIGAEPF